MNFLDNTISEENIEQQLSQLDKWLHAAGDWILAFLPKLITSIIIIGNRKWQIKSTTTFNIIIYYII